MKLLGEIESLKKDHPFWGYRRVWAYLRFRMGRKINHKRIYRLMKKYGLLVPKNLKLKARRTTGSKPRTIEPDVYRGIDMTKIMIPEQGWAYLHLVIDWGSKKILSCSLSSRSKTSDWLKVLNEAVNLQFPHGIETAESKPCLVSDRGSQPTSLAFMKECASLGIYQIFASYGNPKGNAETERAIRTIQEDLIWTREYSSFKELESAISEWVQKYNNDFPHSTLGYMTPYEYERWFKVAVNAA
jgi:transposase InsO family protein